MYELLTKERDNTRIFYILAIIASLLFSGCATHQGEHEQSGMIIGGVLGGLLGSQIGRGHGHSRSHGRTAAIIIGTLAGTAIGGSIGQSMDEVDRMKINHSLETVRTGVPSRWENPDTGNAYTVIPTILMKPKAPPAGNI